MTISGASTLPSLSLRLYLALLEPVSHSGLLAKDAIQVGQVALGHVVLVAHGREHDVGSLDAAHVGRRLHLVLLGQVVCLAATQMLRDGAERQTALLLVLRLLIFIFFDGHGVAV